MLLEVPPEGSRVIGVDPQVFVHVERHDPSPIDLIGGHQASQKLVLAGRGREDHFGAPKGPPPPPGPPPQPPVRPPAPPALDSRIQKPRGCPRGTGRSSVVQK